MVEDSKRFDIANEEEGNKGCKHILTSFRHDGAQIEIFTKLGNWRDGTEQVSVAPAPGVEHGAWLARAQGRRRGAGQQTGADESQRYGLSIGAANGGKCLLPPGRQGAAAERSSNRRRGDAAGETALAGRGIARRCRGEMNQDPARLPRRCALTNE